MTTHPCSLKRLIHSAHLKATRYIVGTITSRGLFKLMVQPASISCGSRLVIAPQETWTSGRQQISQLQTFYSLLSTVNQCLWGCHDWTEHTCCSIYIELSTHVDLYTFNLTHMLLCIHWIEHTCCSVYIELSKHVAVYTYNWAHMLLCIHWIEHTCYCVYIELSTHVVLYTLNRAHMLFCIHELSTHVATLAA